MAVNLKDRTKKALETIQREPMNKKCFVTGSSVPTYVCLEHGIFVSTTVRIFWGGGGGGVARSCVLARAHEREREMRPVSYFSSSSSSSSSFTLV